MNTIKIYLAESGALAQLQKDFPLYQFQYNNKLLNIFVPKSICVGPFIDDDVTSGFVCVVSMKATNSNGVQKQTGAFACRFVKTLVQNGIEYNLFERTLPYSFTQFAGQDQTAPTIYVSILNVSGGSLISMISSQTVHLDVMESNDQFDADFDVDPSAAVELQAQIDAITALLPNKQNADTTYDGEGKVINQSGNNHKVVDNINALLSATADLPDLRQQVEDNTSDIADLKAMSIYGWNVVGTHEIKSQSAQDDNAIPSDADLISWIEALKGAPIAKGDAIYIYWDNFAVADDVSLFWYAETESQGSKFRQVPFIIHTAGNSVAGLIEGTYAPLDLTGKADQLMVDILNGNVVNVYKVKHDESGLVSLKDVFGVVQNKLIDGTQAVAKAIGDEDGLRIKNTYWKSNDGKRYVQDYASPKALYDLNYPDYATGEFKKENVNDNSYNKTTNSASIGYTPLSVIGKNLEADILLGDQNGLVNRVWINSSVTESIKLRIATAYADANNVMQTLSIVETETFQVVAGIPELKQIESVFSGLTTPITLPSGTAISQTIEVWRENSVSADFTLLCNETYNAYMTFNKIGFVRYSLEAEPDAIVSGHDSAPTIDSNGDLVVASTDGEINYANGESAPLTTILKVPMASSIVSGEIKPPKAGDVADYIKNNAVKVIDITDWTSPMTQEQFDLINADPKSIIKVLSGGRIYYYYYERESSTYVYYSSISNQTLNMLSVNKTDYSYSIGTVELAEKSRIASAYDNTKTYKRGDIVEYSNGIYSCKADITTPETWNSAHWTLEASLGNAVNDVCKPFFILSEYEKTLNLFDYDKRKVGYGLIWDTGEIYANANYWTSDFIEIEENKQYAITGNSYSGLSFYNSNKVFISGLSGITSGSTFTSPANAVYVRIASQVSVTEVMLNEGSTALSYQPYNGAIVHEKQLAEQKVSAKVVNFNQLVKNEYTHNVNFPADYCDFAISDFIKGHKIYIKFDIDETNTTLFEMRFRNNANTLRQNVFNGAIRQDVETIITIDSNDYNKLSVYDFAVRPVNYAIVIDLTQQFGAGQEPTLAQCQALFNADYYNYTSGKAMQLIYDGEKPIALVEIPQQLPQLIIDTTTSKAMESGQDNVIYQIDLTEGKYMIIVTSELSTVESWFQLNDYINGNVRKTVAGPGNNGGGLELTDYIEVQSTTTLYIRGYGYGSYTQYARVTVVKLG